MPSLQTWQQAVSPSDLHFNSTTIELRNHHNPAGGLNISNFANSSEGMAQMTIAAERWYPVRYRTCTQYSLANRVLHRFQTRPTALPISLLGATRLRSSKPISTSRRSNFIAAGVGFRTVSWAHYTGSSKISGRHLHGRGSNTTADGKSSTIQQKTFTDPSSSPPSTTPQPATWKSTSPRISGPPQAAPPPSTGTNGTARPLRTSAPLRPLSQSAR